MLRTLFLRGTRIWNTSKTRRRRRGLHAGEGLEDRTLLSAVYGDFNNDGYDDLAIGSPLENIGSIADAGAVHVVYGNSNGLDLDDSQDFQQNSSGVKENAEAGDKFGTALAAGDFNGDGYTDLAIGIPGEDINGVNDAGAVAILYGSASGLGADSSTTARNDQLFHQDTIGIQDDPQRFDRFGSALAAGDFDGDGIDDLAIGIPGENKDVKEPHKSAILDAGAVQILYGTNDGLSALGNDLLFQSNPGGGSSPQHYDFYGSALAAGDVNGDGVDDLAVGIPGEDLSNGRVDAGAVNLLFGVSGNGLSSGGQFLHQDWMIGGDDRAEAFDYFGSSLAIGDVNDDGAADIAVGVPGEDVGTDVVEGKVVDLGIVDAGAVNIFFGSTLLGINNGSQMFTQETAGIEDHSHVGDLFGAAVAIGDFDGDGDGDVAIGVPGEDIKTPTLRKDAGAVHVIKSQGTGGLSSTGNVFFSQHTSGVAGSAETGDAFGSYLAVGDADGDGRADLAVTAPGEDVGNVWNGGGVAVLPGHSTDVLDPDNDLFVTQDALGGGSESGDQMGGKMSELLRINGLQVPVLASNPGATFTLYLDFNGHDDAFAKTPAFDMDGNLDVFNMTELAIIQDIWDTVAEDYAPFDINVTTVSSGDWATEDRIVFGGRWQHNLLTESFVHELPASGVSPGGFVNPLLSNTAYVFTQTVFDGDIRENGVIIGNIASHEAGHEFGLKHKGDFSGNASQNEYSSGGAEWSPIMGSSWQDDRHIWIREEMPHPTNDKLTIKGDPDNLGWANEIEQLTTVLGLRDDDHGNLPGTATHMGELSAIGDLLVDHGIVETRFDADTFTFDVNADDASVKIRLLVNDVAPNLDTILVFGSVDTGEVIASLDPSNLLGAFTQKNVAPGTYYVQVKSANNFHGDIGQFTLRLELGGLIYEGGPYVDVETLPWKPIDWNQVIGLPIHTAVLGGEDKPSPYDGQIENLEKPPEIGLIAPIVDGKGNLSWSKDAAADEYDVLVYDVKKGQAIVDTTTGDTSVAATAMSAPGTYQTFVRSVTADGRKGNWSVLETVVAEPAVPQTPVVKFADGVLAWSNDAATAGYEVLGYDISAGKQVLHLKLTATTLKSAALMTSGKYQVFVRGVNSAGKVGSWGVATFTVESKTNPIPAQPSVKFDGVSTLKWTTDAAAVQYEVLAYDVNAGRQVVKQNVKGDELAAKAFGIAGSYRAYVRGINAAGAAGQWGVVAFETKGVTTTVMPAIPKVTYDAKLGLDWADDRAVVGYEVLMYDTQLGKQVLHTRVRASELPNRSEFASAGRYQVFVRGINSSGQTGRWGVAEFEVAEVGLASVSLDGVFKKWDANSLA